MLTNCDAFDTFPPAPFGLLFRLARHPRAALAVLQPVRATVLRRGPLGFGLLTKRRLTDAETWPWVEPYLTDTPYDATSRASLGVGGPPTWTSSRAGCRRSRSRSCCCGPRPIGSSRSGWGAGSKATFPDARLVEVPDAATFVPLDAAARVAEEIAAFAGQPAVP